MYIGWMAGSYNWTYNNVVRSLIENMPEDNHSLNLPGDVIMVMSLDQLGKRVRCANRSNRKRTGSY